MNREVVAAALAKLRVKSGLHGTMQPIEIPWKVGLAYSRDRAAFTLELRFHHRSQYIALEKEHTETRGRSAWMTGNTWRLSAAGLAHAEAKVLEGVEKTEVRAAEKVCELQVVGIVSDDPALKLKAGDVGTIVHVYPSKRAVEIEITGPKGSRVVTVPVTYLRLMKVAPTPEEP
jgi:hypothetical protein